MAEDKSWDRETIIAAQPNRYELIEISYGIGVYGGRNVLRVKYSHPDPVIAWRIFRSSVAEGVVSVPIGMGFTLSRADDWIGRNADTIAPGDRCAIVWYDKQTHRYHTVDASGGGDEGWFTVCKSAIEHYCNSDLLREERKGQEWTYDGPPNWERG